MNEHYLSEDIFKVLTKQMSINEFNDFWGNNFEYDRINATIYLTDKEKDNWTISIN